MQDITLYLFRFSTYCEKVRWYADRHGIDYQAHYVLPGLHGKTIKTLTGQTAVPVLQNGSDISIESSLIIRKIARLSHKPEEQVTPEFIARHTEFESYFDELGPCLRGYLFSYLFEKPRLASHLFTETGSVSSYLYPFMMSVFGPILKAKIDPDKLGFDSHKKRIVKALDFVADNINETGFLNGESFSDTDLVVAAMLFPICLPEQYPQPVPDKLRKQLHGWFSLWADHPTTKWVEKMYREHRCRSNFSSSTMPEKPTMPNI